MISRALNVYFKDDTVVNLENELSRSQRISCCCCGIKGAALGCYEKSCRKSFHVPCARLTPECRWDSDCKADEAAERIQNFKKSFPGVASWLQEAVTSCHKKGYVETLKGRKRFLSNIKFGNSKEKSKAQRQAVNSICQGSIKIAMICLHDVTSEDSEALCPSFIDAGNFQLLKGRCQILLQVHDELVLEADPSVVKEAGLLLQTCMERAMSLLDER